MTKSAETLPETPAEAVTSKTDPEAQTRKAELVTQATLGDGIVNAPSPKDDWLKIANFWEKFHSEQKSVQTIPLKPKCQYGSIFRKITELPEVKDEVQPGDVMTAEGEAKLVANDLDIDSARDMKKKKSSRLSRFFRAIGRAIRSAFRRQRKI